jgi:hypothetical protein
MTSINLAMSIGRWRFGSGDITVQDSPVGNTKCLWPSNAQAQLQRNPIRVRA